MSQGSSESNTRKHLVPGEVLVVLSRSARSLLGPRLDTLLEALGREVPWRIADRFPESDSGGHSLTVDSESTRSILIVGGDGTVNLVLNSCPDLTVPVAVFPAGTANDLANCLGIPPDIPSTVSTILAGQETALDKIRVNDRIFCTMGGMGLPGDSAMRVGKFRRKSALRVRAVHRLGASTYWVAAALGILLGRGQSRDLTVAYRPIGHNCETTLQVSTPGILVANQPVLAGRLSMSPDSKPDDGIFEIVILRESTRAGLLSLLIRLARGGTPREEEVLVLKTDQALLRCPFPQRFFGDGEILCTGTEFRLDLASSPLRILCPASRSNQHKTS